MELIDEEMKEYEELKSLLYQDSLTQYGKRKLIGIIEKQQKEIKNSIPKSKIKEINENTDMYYEFYDEVMKLVESEEK